MTILKHKSPPCVARGDGFTLVEVLVSLVVLSIGLLGIAKLMLFSSHSNDSAYLRSQATALAYEILDDMRANRQEAIIAGTYNTAAAVPAAVPGALCIGVGSCTTPTQLALYDLYQWGLHLNANSGAAPPGALPNGQGSVTTVTAGTQTTVTIVVSWDDSVAQNTLNLGGLTTQKITLETVL
ncbi:MAG TPA: type IV pilus modification protein PilV [Steroidobacteraceae bacterium]|jgi:type IV pilus assembly protein PilV|nr:type IV pilus modification protein PilV [Steroidobacteraceae bacterium]